MFSCLNVFDWHVLERRVDGLVVDGIVFFALELDGAEPLSPTVGATDKLELKMLVEVSDHGQNVTTTNCSHIRHRQVGCVGPGLAFDGLGMALNIVIDSEELVNNHGSIQLFQISSSFMIVFY